MKWEQGQKGRKTAAKELRLEREAKQQQHAALIAIDGPSALVSRPITLTPADTSEARALRHMTERLDHLRAPSFDLSLHSSTMYEALLEACVARGGSALAKSVFALLCKRTSNVQQMIKWAVMRDEEKGYNALPYQLLDYLVIPSTSHFRATLDAIPQDDANYIEQVYEAINEAQRALVRLRLDRDWLQERLAGVPRSTARGALDVDAYMKKLSSGIAELEAGLEAIEVDVRYGVAVFAEQAHNELQALAPTSDFPIRDTLSAKADFYSLPVRDLVSFQLKYFPVAQAALRSRWRSRILQDMRGKQARPDINQATSLIGIMAPFSSARDRWSIYPRHPYGTCAEIFASLSARSSLVYDLLYLWNGKGQRVWEVMARQPFQALPVSLRPVARLRAVLDQWPEFGRTLNAKVRYEGSRGQRSLAMTVYESTMAESIHR